MWFILEAFVLFSKAAATKMVTDIIKIILCAAVYVMHHQFMKLMK